MNMHFYILMVIIFSMGLLGGVINFFINQKKKYKTSWYFWMDFAKAIFVGIGAAVLVPLFLNMVSSDLLERTGIDEYSYFVFAGFCLIAAITSDKFIGSISDKILKTASEAIGKVEELEKILEPIIAKEKAKEAANELDPD